MPSPTIFFTSVASEASGGVASSSDRSVGLKQPVGPCRQLFSPAQRSLSMAKHQRRRRRSKGFVAIPFDGDLVIGTLLNDAVIQASVVGAVFTEDFYCISADLQLTVSGLTAGEGDPSTVGYNHGDYSAAQVAENLNVQLLGPGNKLQQEQSRRLVRRAGALQSLTGLNDSTQLNLVGGGDGGRIIRTKLKFVVQSGQELELWFMNRSGATITTGAQARFSGTLYGRWIL